MSTELTRGEKDFIKLVLRSPDKGGGWRSVSKAVWGLVEPLNGSELFEVDAENQRVRLSEKGKVVAEYLP